MKIMFMKSLIGFLIVFASTVQAAQAPKSIEELTKSAAQIVTGKVIEVDSKVGSAKADKGFFNKDKFFTIKLKVSQVVKGTGVKLDETITLVTWKLHSRPFWHAGPQGMDTIPKKGDSVTVYIKLKDGSNFKPILPNGIVIQKIEKKK